MQASTTKTCAARQGATCPGKQALAWPISANLNRSGPFFAGFKNDLYEDQKAAGSPDQPPNQPLIRAES